VLPDHDPDLPADHVDSGFLANCFSHTGAVIDLHPHSRLGSAHYVLRGHLDTWSGVGPPAGSLPSSRAASVVAAIDRPGSLLAYCRGASFWDRACSAQPTDPRLLLSQLRAFCSSVLPDYSPPLPPDVDRCFLSLVYVVELYTAALDFHAPFILDLSTQPNLDRFDDRGRFLARWADVSPALIALAPDSPLGLALRLFSASIFNSDVDLDVAHEMGFCNDVSTPCIRIAGLAQLLDDPRSAPQRYLLTCPMSGPQTCQLCNKIEFNNQYS
jgi:hypothetical protein